MTARTELLDRFSILFNPGTIIIGYILTLFAVVAGVAAFPFSTISMVLLSIVVGVFFVVSVPIILATYVFLAIGIYRALMSFSRWLLFGSEETYDSGGLGKRSPMNKDLASEPADAGLWDRWIDGV